MALEPLEERRMLFAGLPDETFDNDGALVSSLAATHDQAEAIALQSDGKIVAVGSAYDGQKQLFALARYNVDGSLDTTFDFDGRVLTDFGGSAAATSVAIQTDGKIVVAGYTYVGSAFRFALARYNADGSLDSTFAGDGRVTTAFGNSSDSAFAVAIQSDGKILAGGESYDGPAVGASSSDFALARYNSNGALDTSFGTGGVVRTSLGPKNDRIEAISIVFGRVPELTRIVVAGWTTPGSRDTTVPASTSPTDTALAQYDLQGNLDPFFSGDGIAILPFSTGFDKATAMVEQSSGEILIAGSTIEDNAGAFLLARVLANGQLDPAFGVGGGVTITSFGAAPAGANAIAIQEGQIVLAGFSRFNDPAGQIDRSGFAIARYNANGIPDTAFGDAGRVTRRLASPADVANAVAIQPDGRIVAAGAALSGGLYDFGLVRYRDTDPPVALDDSAVTSSSSVSIDVLENDVDPEGPLFLSSIIITSDPTQGSVSFDSESNLLIYHPPGNNFGSDSFRYRLVGRYGDLSNEATVTITEILPPVAVEDSVARLVPSGSTWSSLGALSIPLLNNDFDTDGALDPTSVTITSPPSIGTVTIDPVTGVASYTRTNSEFGDTSFRYTVRDNQGLLSNEATVNIAVNYAPIAQDNGAQVGSLPVTLNVLQNDSDPDGTLDPASVVITSFPAEGTVTVNPNGTITYTPGISFDGDEFSYTVRDNRGAVSNVATVELVLPILPAPPAESAAAGAVALAPIARSGDLLFTNGNSQVKLHYETIPLSGGLVRYDVYIDDPTNAQLSYFVDALSFTGAINQNSPGVTRVDKSSEAAALNGPSYNAATDTYFFGPFTDNLVATGIVDSGPVAGTAARTIKITAGSGGGSRLDSVKIAQIVAQGDIVVGGFIARNGLNYSLSPSAVKVMTAEPNTTPPPSAEQIANFTALVNLAAQRLLGHALDSTLAASFQAQIAAGASQIDLAASLWVLPEHLGRRVDALYQSILRRAPDSTTRTQKINALAAGGTENEIARELLLSSEYQAINVANGTFVDSLYRDLLGRVADPAGRQSWITALETSRTRAQVIDSFLSSAERQGRFADQLSLQILAYPNSQPFTASLPAGVRADAGTLGKAFLSSTEFLGQAVASRLSAADRAYVDALSRQLNGRPAVASEIAQASGSAATAQTRAALAQVLWRSEAHLGREVDALFQSILRRPVDAAGRAAYVQLLAGGATLDTVAASLLNSQEYRNTHLSDGAFVDGMYRDVLGRAPDNAGRAAWVTALATGRTRAEVVQAFLTSDERALRVINSLYVSLLNRRADAGGQQIYLTLWRQGSRAEQIAYSLLSSDEFLLRFAR